MAMYAYPRTCLRSYIVPSGSNRFDVSQVLSDRAPSLLVVGLVNAQAFGGSLNTNPYHLEHFDLNHIGFQLNSSLKPGAALEPDFGASSFAEAYSSFHELSQGKGNGITQSNFKKGNAPFLFQSSTPPDQSTGRRIPRDKESPQSTGNKVKKSTDQELCGGLLYGQSSFV